MTDTRYYAGVPCRRARITKEHRLALWEGILATVYAKNADGVVRYFDYAWSEAAKFAGINEDSDPRIMRVHVSLDGRATKATGRNGQYALFIRRES